MFSALSPASAGSSTYNLLSMMTGQNTLPQSYQDITTDYQDIFSVSDTSRQRSKALDLFAPLTTMGTMESMSNTKTLAQVGADLAEDLSGLSSAFGALFRSSNIDDSEAILLKPDLEGHVTVGNNHPDGNTVNGLLKQNNPMVSRIMVALARASLINASETNPQFNSDYQNDPRAAIKEHIDLLRDRLESSGLSIQGGTATPVFA